MLAPPTLRRSSLARLLRIILELQGGRTPSTRQLAETCGVSRRTIFRDLSTIEEAGIVVEYDAIRLGYRLASTNRVDRARLDDDEIVALFLHASRSDQSDESGFDEASMSGALKLLHDLPAAERVRLETVVVPPPLRPVLSPSARDRRIVYADLIEGIRRGVLLELGFVGNAGVDSVSIEFCPYLLYHEAGWNVIGFSASHDDVIPVAIGSVARVSLTDRPAVVPPRFRADGWLHRKPGVDKTEVRLRIGSEAAALLSDARWSVRSTDERRPDDEVVVDVPTDRLESFVIWCIRHADAVEVIDPASLRLKIREAALRLVQRYASNEPRTTG